MIFEAFSRLLPADDIIFKFLDSVIYQANSNNNQ